MPEFKERLDEAMRIRDISAAELSRISKVNEGAISQYRAGKYKASQRSLDKLARALNVNIPWLMGADVPMTDEPSAPSLPSPAITEDTITFPIVTSVAAHYDSVSTDESATGEHIEVPSAYLKGRKPEEFCAMRVRGDSMFPSFQDGDVVLVLKQTAMNHSGEIGVISYGEDEMTIKRINYIDGEDWIELVPLNNLYPPKRIAGVDLESCHIIGIPRVLIREF